MMIHRVLFSIFVVMFCAAVNAQGTKELDSEPLIVLEERYKEILDERRRLKEEVRAILPTYNSSVTALESLKNLKVNLVGADEIISNLKTALSDLAKLAPGTKLGREHPEVRKYRLAYENFDNLNVQLYRAVNQISSSLPYGNLTQGEKVVSRIVDNAQQVYYEKQEAVVNPLRALLAAFPYDIEIPKSRIESEIEAAQKYLAAYTDSNISAEFETQKRFVKEELEDIQRNLGNEIESRNKRIEDLLGTLSEVSELLESKKTKQSIIDQGLIYAVYSMIGVLLLMFLALRIFPENVALELVKRRSLIEVVGMAFMLITIIILGTGGKIGTETLGTLLGTIAGYIFGRIGSDRQPEALSDAGRK